MKNFIHRLTPFTYLHPSNPMEYGFDTVQLGFDPFNKVSVDHAAEMLAGGFGENMNVILAFTPKESGPIIDNLFSGTISGLWYEDLLAAIAKLSSIANGRVIGVRWNHEYRPSRYAQTKDWETWLRSKDYAMWQYVLVPPAQKAIWDSIISATKETVNPVQFLERTSGTQWDAPGYENFRQTYKWWVKYRCQWGANIINTLAKMISEQHPSYFLMVYPGGSNSTLSPRLIPDIEYTLDYKLLKERNIILELGGWSSFSEEWVKRTASSIDKGFIYTNQIDLRSMEPSLSPTEYRYRMNSINLSGFKPIAFGLWTDWSPTLSSVSTRDIQSYFDNLRPILLV